MFFVVGDYIVEVCQVQTGLLRARLKSRHSESTKYRTVLKYNPMPLHAAQSNDSQSEKIFGWYCTCKVGARTVGMCAHAASILWYYGLGQKNGVRPRTIDLNAIFEVSSGESEDDDDY